MRWIASRRTHFERSRKTTPIFCEGRMRGLLSWINARTLKPRTSDRRSFLAVESLDDRSLPSVTTTFTLYSDWGSGFVGEVRMKNEGSTAVTNWNLEFDFNRSIDNIWCASIVSHVGDHYVVANVGWNSAIAPG